MSSLFLILVLITIGALGWGLIFPHHYTKAIKGRYEVKRRHTAAVFLPLMILFFVLFGMTSPPQPVNVQRASYTSTSQTQKQEPKKPSAPTVTTQQETVTQSVPYTTQNQNDSSLAKGQTNVAQQGKNGTETLTYIVTYTNGQQTNKKLVSTEVTTQPVTQITDIGTYVAPTPAPTPTPTPAPAPSPTPTPTQSCYPTASSGNCYEPGEFCSNADHGMSGVAGDGKSIVCADNNGWRWEPQ